MCVGCWHGVERVDAAGTAFVVCRALAAMVYVGGVDMGVNGVDAAAMESVAYDM